MSPLWATSSGDPAGLGVRLTAVVQFDVGVVQVAPVGLARGVVWGRAAGPHTHTVCAVLPGSVVLTRQARPRTVHAPATNKRTGSGVTSLNITYDAKYKFYHKIPLWTPGGTLVTQWPLGGVKCIMHWPHSAHLRDELSQSVQCRDEISQSV